MLPKRANKNIANFIKDSNLNTSRQALNELKTKNPERYRVQTLGMLCVNLGLDYDDLIDCIKLKK